MSEQTAKTENNGLVIPDSVLNELRQESKRRDIELNDLINDYVMLNPELTLAVTDQR